MEPWEKRLVISIVVFGMVLVVVLVIFVFVIYDDDPTAATPPAAAGPTTPAPAPCPSITYAANGNAGPALCDDRRPNPALLRYFDDHLLLHLTADADPAHVLSAICSDLGPPVNSSLSVEETVYELARARAGWRFGIDPFDELRAAARPCQE